MGFKYHCSRPNLNIITVKEHLKNHAKFKIVFLYVGKLVGLLATVISLCYMHLPFRM